MLGRRVRGTLLAAFAWPHAGCSVPVLELDATTSPIAVGAHAYVAARSRTCDDVGCTFEAAEIASLSLDPPGVFELASEPRHGEVSFKAIAWDVTALEIVASVDGETKTLKHTLAALPIDKITMAPRRGDSSCAEALYSTSMVAMLPIQLRSAGTLLHGEGFAAIHADNGTVDTALSDASMLVLEMPALPGMVTLTSTADPDFGFVVEAVAPEAISSVTLQAADSHLTPLTSTEVSVDVFAGARLMCGDGLTHVLTSETPMICRIVDDEGTVTSVSGIGLSSARVVGVRSGICTLRVTIGTTSLTATASLDVTM